MISDCRITLDRTLPEARTARAAERKLFERNLLGCIEHDLEVDGCRLRVLESGHGYPLIVLPGGCGDAWPYAPLMKRLTNWRLLAVNRPGGGLSDGINHRRLDLRDLALQTIGAVYDHFRLDRAAFVAGGMGGLWVFWHAIENPDSTVAITQLGCPALLGNTSAPLPMRVLSIPLLNRFLIEQMIPKSLESARQIPVFLGHSDITWTEADAACAYAFTHLPTYKPSWLSLMETTLTPFGTRKKYRIGADELRRVKAPVQFVWGRNDPFGGIAAAEHAVVMVPTGILREIPGGHLPWLDDAAQCARWIDSFTRDVISGHTGAAAS